MGRQFWTPLVLLGVLAGVTLATAGAVPGALQNHRRGGTLVFGTAADPVVLDGALVSDGESLRVIDQMFEGLVDLRPGTTRLIPSLATSWKASPNGLSWTFNLRRGVRFHDGTQFNARAVCFNFNRWFNFSGTFQNPDATYYWQTVFGGFRRNLDPTLPKSLYRSCQAVNQFTARINLTKRSSSFIGALALKNFAIASPTALRRFGADRGRVDENGVFRPTGTYGNQHPTGTGPFRFSSWTVGNRLVIVRWNGYWGRKAHFERVIFRPIANNAARLTALETGEIQGYDLVAPEDMPRIRRSSSLKLLDRPAFNVAYVGFNSSKPPMNRLAVRQAVAYGLDRARVVQSFYGGRGQVATQFQPPQLVGWSPRVKKYNYDPERAQRLLRGAGLTLPVRIEFFWPSAVSRPYMPDPRRNAEAFAASLERAGFEVVLRSLPWRPDYLSAAQKGDAGHLRLLGWTGDFGDPDNFVGTFFQSYQDEWGFRNARLTRLLDSAERETNLQRRIRLYRQANELIMQLLPGVPYAHTKPALGFQRRVRNFIPSPVTLEPFSLAFYGR